ncbi:inactive serine/threonine-protein kinase TEX14 isoform X3 [Coturnix japonica]|uniref:inactive serine/threonine-protein kinase TEX14 isoform X3 n=1 Tax=Coturnix japonica TaxID=93934 RepID=UPI000776F5B7|nr:inactive serine/threonine-protein kinase TEX14 isoform X3 [Coturnix japonica]
MAHPLPIPCPVQLGTLKGDSLEAELHHSVRDGNCGTVRKILKKGASVDAVNSLGQTPLFTAALLGLGKIVDVLLDYGSDPNHRCYDGSTPVHAAAFSGSQWILSKLLDEGGDLRVHDEGGRNPQCWAMSAGKESSAQMLEFIQRCTFHMQAAIQNFPYDPVRKIYSSKALVSSPSRFSGLVQGNADSPLGRFLKGGVNAAKNIYSFGFGKFYLAGSSHLGYLASLPIIGEKEVVQADDEPTFSYRVGPYMIMTNLMWGSSRVTVKELSFQPHQNCSKLRLADLLIAEQEHSSKLRHPHLLQLMSVCLSSDLEKTRLVYERVNFGSLYSILHERRSEFPVLRMETILHILLQINDALRFLHSRGFIHRTISSYAIQIVSSGEAKLCNMEYMIESKDGGEHSDLTRIPVPAQLYKWCSPEVILEKSVTVKSDIYSFCTVMQEALTETLPWNGIEDSVIKQLVISGQQLEADVRLPVPYYDIVKSGLESKQKNRTMNLQDIQFTLKNDLKDLSKSQSCHADEMAKAQRPAVFADINICLSSTFSYRKRTLELNKGGSTGAASSAAPRCPAFPEENNTLVDIEAPTSVQLDAQENTDDAASETQMTCSVSDVDDSLCSFEMNEVFASCPDFHEGFLKKGAELNRTQDDKKRQQKEKDENVLGDMFLSPGMYCEEKPVDEEGGVSESVAEYTTEEEERKSEASDLSTLAQVRGDAGRRRSTLPSNEHHISKCVLDLKIVQSMLQQVAESLSRTEKNLDKLEAAEKQKKLLQEVGNSRLSKQVFHNTPCNRSDSIYQNTNSPFSAANTSLWKAEGPPSRDYIPPLVTCHSQGALCGDSFQSVSNVTEEMWAVQNEKWKCFHQRSESKNENSQHDLSFRELKSLDDQVDLDHEHLLPRVSARWENKFNFRYQRGSRSHSAASGSKEERCCYPKLAPEIHRTKKNGERMMMQPEWTTEVRQMARKVASGRLELIAPHLASDCTSESEVESIKEAFQHVTSRAQKGQDQHRYRWYRRDSAEPWNVDCEDESESEESDLDSLFRSSEGGSCQSSLQDEQAESGPSNHKNLVISQQIEIVSRGHSRELPCSLNSYPSESEEFLTPDDYFLPPAVQERSELKVEDTDTAGTRSVSPKLDKQMPEGAGSGIQVSGGKILFCGTAAQNSGNNTRGVNQLSHMPVASTEAAQEMISTELQEDSKEKDISVTDIQDLSSIPCKEENYYGDINCKTPGVSRAPPSVSTPISAEEKMPVAFEKHRCCHEVVLDSSSCVCQEVSSAVSRTFNTAYEEERSTEVFSASPGVCSSGLNEPDGLSVVASSSRSTRKAPECLKQQDSNARDFMEEGLCDCRVQRNDSGQIRMESTETKKEMEIKEECDCGVQSMETFNLAEETESRAHSTLDDALERMLCAVPADEQVQEQEEDEEIQGYALGAASLRDPRDVGRKKKVEEGGARARSSGADGCAGSSEGKHSEDQRFRLREHQSSASPFRVIILDQDGSPT